MKQDLKVFKSIIIFNIILTLIISIIIKILYPGYVIPFIIGSCAAVFSFSMNISGVKLSFTSSNSNHRFAAAINLFIRIAVICVIAVLLINKNKYNIIPYILGYNNNIISILMYGLKLKKIEGM